MIHIWGLYEAHVQPSFTPESVRHDDRADQSRDDLSSKSGVPDLCSCCVLSYRIDSYSQILQTEDIPATELSSPAAAPRNLLAPTEK